MDTTVRERRREGIGGSDIAALVGMNPYRTVHDLWLEKVGLVEPADDPPSEAAYWGQQLEAILCDEYARRENVVLHRVPTATGIITHPVDTWFMGSPDRLVGDGTVGMDAKMAGLRQASRWGEEGTDRVPGEYLLQCQWYLRLTGAVRWDLAVLLGQQFRIYRVDSHKKLQDALLNFASRFWFENVVPKVPPEVDHTDGARRLLEKVYPMQQDEIRPATDEEIALAQEMHVVTKALQAAEMKHAHLRALICNQIALAEGIAGPGFRFVWKRTKDSTHVDWERVAKYVMGMMKSMDKLPDEHWQAIVGAHSENRPGQRRFRATFGEDAEDA